MSVWNWKVSNKEGQKVNYQKELDKLILELKKEEKVPRLLLHSCCAPCSSYVLEYLSQYFEVTVFYYNPNIYPESEYTKRVLEQQKLISEMRFKHPVTFIAGNYDSEKFYNMARGLENVCLLYTSFQKNFKERYWKDLFYRKENGKYQLDLWKANEIIFKESGILPEHIAAVSYTHLDVYKRQVVKAAATKDNKRVVVDIVQ